MSEFVYRIREASAGDYKVLPDVENDAGEIFRDFGLMEVANSDPISVSYFESLEQLEHCLYVAETDKQVIGFALAIMVGDYVYLKEISVRRSSAGNGIGRLLVEKVVAWSKARGDQFLYLATFADLPFNAPFYKRLGFEVFDPCSSMRVLYSVLCAETAWCPDGHKRVAMRLCLES